MYDAKPADTAARGEMPSRRQRATAKIVVQRSESHAFDESVSPALAEFQLEETFLGDDWAGHSAVRALQLLRDDKSANMVSMQRFVGTLCGRRGTFVLQGSETVLDRKVSAKWFVVPQSATDELSGLRGEGGFEGEFGKGSVGTLDFWFE